jgi:hypothetical protein
MPGGGWVEDPEEEERFEKLLTVRKREAVRKIEHGRRGRSGGASGSSGPSRRGPDRRRSETIMMEVSDEDG